MWYDLELINRIQVFICLQGDQSSSKEWGLRRGCGNVNHWLMACRQFGGLRRRLYKAAKKTKTPASHKTFLTSPPIFEALADFIQRLHQFYKARHWQYIPTKPPSPPPLALPWTLPCPHHLLSSNPHRPNPLNVTQPCISSSASSSLPFFPFFFSLLSCLPVVVAVSVLSRQQAMDTNQICTVLITHQQ